VGIARRLARDPEARQRRLETVRFPLGLRGVTAAVMIEPILGEAGVYPVPDEMLVAAREACDEACALLVFDEIQSGIGRTGSLWAHQQTPVRPDVMTTAKALGGGLPIGACLASPDLADLLQPGDHGSTFAGGPLIATAAMAVTLSVNAPANRSWSNGSASVAARVVSRRMTCRA